MAAHARPETEGGCRHDRKEHTKSLARDPGMLPQSGFVLSVLCGRQTQGEDLSRLLVTCPEEWVGDLYLTGLLKSLDKSNLNLHLNCFSLCLSSLLLPSRILVILQ